jgi:SAM-dependent methyltransferase
MKKLKKQKTLKLDLGCGNNKQEGFTGVDFKKTPAVDIVHDLFKFPWPFKDNSVEETFSSHFFEHVPGSIRGKLMDEVYRILIPGGKAVFITPYWSSMRSVQDFTHQWPPICETSYLYFNKGWREQNKLGQMRLRLAIRLSQLMNFRERRPNTDEL